MRHRERRTTPSLRLYRGLAEKSQREVAEEAGVSAAFVCQLETGRKGARPSTIEALASAVYVEPDDLVREPGPGDAPKAVAEGRTSGGPHLGAPGVGETVVLRQPSAAKKGTVQKVEVDEYTGRTRLLLDGAGFPFPFWVDLLFVQRKEVTTP